MALCSFHNISEWVCKVKRTRIPIYQETMATSSMKLIESVRSLFQVGICENSVISFSNVTAKMVYFAPWGDE